MVLWIANDGHVNSEPLCHGTFRHGLFRVIRAFGMYIRPEILEQRFHVWLGKDYDVIHVAQGGNQLGAGLLVQNGPPGSLEAAYTGVGIYTYHEKVSFPLCSCQVSNVADVQSIKTSVRKDHTPSAPLCSLEQGFQFRPVDNFGLGRPHTLASCPGSRIADRTQQFVARN